MGSKGLHIRFDEIDGFIKIYDGIRYLVLFGSGQYIMQFIIGLDILYVKKVILQVVLIIILQESKLIHIIL